MHVKISINNTYQNCIYHNYAGFFTFLQISMNNTYQNRVYQNYTGFFTFLNCESVHFDEANNCLPIN